MKKISNFLYVLIGIAIFSFSVNAQNFLTENFDGTFPNTGWSTAIQSGSYNWTKVASGSSPTCTPKAGSGMIMYQSYNASSNSCAILSAPPLNLTGTCKPTISFYMYGDPGYSGNADRIEVYVNSTNSTSTWTMVGSFNRYNSSAAWYEKTVDLTNYRYATTYIFFRAYSMYGNNIFMDELSIDEKGLKAEAKISSFTSPDSKKPVPAGNVSITADLTNTTKAVNITAAYIDWDVKYNNQVVNSGTYYWTGNMKEGESTSLNLGSFVLNYPPTGPFGAYRINTTVRDVVAAGSCGSNTTMAYLDVFGVLNDAGVTGVMGPVEGFGPGSTPVRVRVKNYAPKPINSVRIRWIIDGVEQPSFTASGLNIPYLSTGDILVGNYTFYNKTPMGPFTVKAWTEVPNGVIDEDKTNDEYNGGIGPSFVPGTYTIGGYAAHFANLQDASSYLSGSGVLGTGDVVFEIRPGTYTGQITANASLANNNKIEFRSSTGRASDVTIQHTPSAANNYVMMIDGMKNITLKNITFKNTATNYSFAGRVLALNNCSNIKLEYCNVYGVASSPRDVAYSNLYMNNTNMAYISNNIILNGAIGIRNEGSATITYSSIDNNIISDYNWMGISNNLSTTGHNVVIANNVIRNTNTIKPPYGISSVNGTSITNNIIDGLTGTGTDSKEAGIYLAATIAPTDYTVVTGNQVTNLVNVNGIYAENTKVKILKNLVNANLTAASNMSLFNNVNTSGYAGNNMFNGGNISGFRNSNSADFYFLYNTVVNNSTTYPSVYTTGTSGMIHRNIFQNLSTGPVTDFWGTLNNNENNYFTNGATLIKYNGTVYTFAAFQALGIDVNSSNKVVTFEDAALNNLKLKLYVAELLKTSAIAGLPEPMNTDLQAADYEGNPRASFYIGADEIKLEIMIDRQSEGIIDCIGGLDNNISVSARMSYGAAPTYQWEKDGVAIAGQNKEIMFFNAMKLSDNGVYRCLVKGPGDTKEKYSEPVTVYVVTPTEITEEPANNIIPLGETAMFTFQAHVNGRKVADALKMNEITIQWYKVKAGGDVALADDKRIAGAKSNIVSIKEFNVADEGEYYAVITGLCGTATTAKAQLKIEELKVMIDQQPLASANCEGDDVIFSIEASTPSAKALTYQWFKDGTEVAETSTTTGTKSKHLTIYGAKASNSGTYYCEVTLEGTAVMEKSADAALTVGTKPSIVTQPTDVEVQVGKAFSLTVELDDESDVTFEWFKSGTSIGTAKSFKSNTAVSEDAGKYWVVATNKCGFVKSVEVNVVVTTGTVGVFDSEDAGYALSNVFPTPSNEVANLNYTIPVSGLVRISIADVNGSEVIELLNETVSAGTKSLEININNLSNGVYFVIMNTGSTKLMQRLTVVK